MFLSLILDPGLTLYSAMLKDQHKFPPRGGGSTSGIFGWSQVNFATLYQIKLSKSPHLRLSQSSCFPETTEVTNTVQRKQNRLDFFIFLSGNPRFP